MTAQNSILISHPASAVTSSVKLPSSKSESNRALIINACTQNQCNLLNLSEARDTQTLQRLLLSDDKVLDVLDAGTAMRFLTAYITVTNQQRVLTGTPRMQQRPIGILVEALRALGGNIDYVKTEGCPPLDIKGFQYLGNNKISIRGDVSSQFISALLMVAPLLPAGLELHLEGKIGSRPYIEMTLALMENFSVYAVWNEQTILVKPQTYQPQTFQVESDWSASSYWYSIVALAETAEVTLLGLKKNSLQGDSVITEIMKSLGVNTEFIDEGVILSKIEAKTELDFDFSNCPDLAQTIAVICAAKNIPLRMTGVESLQIKETDRTLALQNELRKLGHTLVETAEAWVLTPNTHAPIANPHINTYEDHRMAMAFAPLALLMPIEIEEPGVVAKSYPRFWEDLAKAGFVISNIE